MEHRKTMLVACLLLAGTVAGCSAIPGFGSSCGPGENEIGGVGENASEVNLKGELTDIRNSSMVIDDGTGSAEILLVDDEVKDQVETGDCIIANGTAAQTNDSDEDVVIVAEELLREE